MIYNILRYYDKLRMNTNIYKYIKKTPITQSLYLSKFTNNNVLYKREDLQSSAMFNVRGTCMRLLNLSKKEKENGVVVYGYDDYTKGIMYMSNQLKINSTVMLPKNTPKKIINEIHKYQEKINSYSENIYTSIYLYKTLYEGLNKKTKLNLFNDQYIIAGNSTIAYEILMDYKNIDKIFVPIINGNLAAGILVGIKNVYPNIKVIGVTYDGHFNKNKDDDHIISNFAFDICNIYLDDIIKVNIYEIENAIEIIYNDTNTVVKPDGALSAAGIYKYTKQYDINNENIIGIVNNTNYVCF